ncbi:MAG: tripartite tricarboxylate transporter substrate binding protein [Betaproteobacteria bacterium]|nr:tripartite tricarboxylate transporter substrate binding protein [Betaproteobacteria bacterium]
MNPSRRILLKAAAASALSFPASRAYSQAAPYPTRQIISIGSFAPGTGADIAVRFYSEKLHGTIGKPVVVEPKVGMGGTMAAAYAAQARPDGHTIYLAPSSTVLAAAPSLFKKLPYDPIKDFVPVLALFKTAFILVVPASAPYKTLPELTAHLREKGNKASYGTATLTGRVAAELYKTQFGLAAVEVPYKSGITAINDMLSGLFDFYFTDTGTAKAHIGPGGRLRPLAVTSQTRMDALPEVPGAAGAGLKMNFVACSGLHVPAQTPRPIIDQLAAWMEPIAASEDARKFLATLGYDPWLGNARVVTDMLERETRNWAEYIRLAKIEPQ